MLKCLFGQFYLSFKSEVESIIERRCFKHNIEIILTIIFVILTKFWEIFLLDILHEPHMYASPSFRVFVLECHSIGTFRCAIS